MPAEDAGAISDPVRWRILVVLLAVIFMSLIGVSIVNVALPSIQQSLNATQSDMQWVLSGYALTFGVILVAAGRAGDLVGRGGIFLIGVAVFTLASVAAGLAPDPAWLNGARFAQGIGSGLLNPQGIGMIQQYFRGAERGRAFGYFGTAVGFSVAIGPVLGGLLIELGGLHLGWRLTFLVNVPIGIIAMILGFLWFPRPLIHSPASVASRMDRLAGQRARGRSAPAGQVPASRQVPASGQVPESRQVPDAGQVFASGRPPPAKHVNTAGSVPGAARPVQVARASGLLSALDPVGSALLGLAVLAVLFPFVESQTSALLWVLFPLGFLLVYLWIRWERYYERLGYSPMVNLDIFATRSFTNGSIIMTLYFLGMTSIWVLVALYVQEGDGRSALEAGLFGIPAALLSAYAAHWAGKRVMRYGRKVVIWGLILAQLGLWLSIAVVLLHEQGRLSVWWLLLTLSFIGLAQGSVISPNQALTLADVPLDYAGSSGAIMQTGQRIGTSVGIAMITAAVFATLSAASWPVAVALGFALISVVLLLALVVAFKDQRDRQRQQIRAQALAEAQQEAARARHVRPPGTDGKPGFVKGGGR